MALLGYDDLGSVAAYNPGGVPQPMFVSPVGENVFAQPTTSGTATHAYVNIAEGADGSRSIRVALYDSSDNLLAHTEITPAASFTGVIGAALNTPVAISESSEYRIAIQGSHGNLRFTRNSGASLTWSRYTTTPDYATAFEDPISGALNSASIGHLSVWIEDESEPGGEDVELSGTDAEIGVTSSAGTLVATSPAIRVDDVLQDTDTGELVDIASTELVVLGGTAGNRTIAANPTGVEVSDGVVEIPGPYTIDGDYLVAIVEDSDRMSILPATVIDRNAD